MPPQPPDAAHDRFYVAVCFEAAVCFAIPTIALLFGAVRLPILVLDAVMHPYMGAWRPVAMIWLGAAGIAGVSRLVYLLCTKAPHDRLRWMTLLALACGTAVSVGHWLTIQNHDAPGGLEVLMPIVYLPLACTLHLLYLARRPLFWPRREG